MMRVWVADGRGGGVALLASNMAGGSCAAAQPLPASQPTPACRIARIGGTVRHTSDEGMTALRKRLEEAVAAIAAVHRCTAEVRACWPALCPEAERFPTTGPPRCSVFLLTRSPARTLVPPTLPPPAGGLDAGHHALLPAHRQRPARPRLRHGRGRQVRSGRAGRPAAADERARCSAGSRGGWRGRHASPLLTTPPPLAACRLLPDPGAVGETEATMAGEVGDGGGLRSCAAAVDGALAAAVPSRTAACLAHARPPPPTLASLPPPGLFLHRPRRALHFPLPGHPQRDLRLGCALGRQPWQAAAWLAAASQRQGGAWALMHATAAVLRLRRGVSRPAAHLPCAPLPLQCTACTPRASRWTRAC